MAVHYPKALITQVRDAGLRLVTIDCGSGIRYQGGCTPDQHHLLIRMIEDLCQADAKRTLAVPAMTNGLRETLADKNNSALAELTRTVDEAAGLAAIPATPAAKSPRRDKNRKRVPQRSR